MVPARAALALQADGWFLRQEITICKRNPMPESANDRPTTATEKLYLFSKSERYFYDAEAVKEKASSDTHPKGDAFINPRATEPGQGIKQNTSFAAATPNMVATRNLRNWWEIVGEHTTETALDFDSADFIDRQGLPRTYRRNGLREIDCPIHSINPDDDSPSGRCKVTHAAHFATYLKSYP